MFSFGFIKPPQKEMVHIPKSSSENTDVAEKEDRVELFDIRLLHLSVILHKHRPHGLSWAEEQQMQFRNISTSVLMLEEWLWGHNASLASVLCLPQRGVYTIHFYIHGQPDLWAVPFNFKSINWHTYTTDV